MFKRMFCLAVSVVMLLSLSAFATDGVILINQASVNNAGGFPYKITQSGSYRLSGNLTVAGATDAIDVLADNVTLDLNGFSIIGPVTCDGNFNTATTACTGNGGTGVQANNQNNVTVRNGTIRGMNIGISLVGSGALVEEVHAFKNAFEGIDVSFSGVVRRNTATNNGATGIAAQVSVVTQNVANLNRGSGIYGNLSTISNNTAYNNIGNGITSSHSKVTDNTSAGNSGFGLLVSGGLYGSNSFNFNTSGSVSGTAVSQNNNNCDGILC